ncbi:MAG: DUF1302 family protein, partial [Campylobacterota bacterium]|nr:DUF1302 family protein [Campylobacterota bacterium]
MKRKLFISLVLSSLLINTTLLADELDDLDGFGDDEEEIVIKETPTVEKEASDFSFGGDVAFKTSVGYKKHKVDGVEYQGFNQLQISLALDMEYKISDNWKFKMSGDAYYDAIYDLRSKTTFNDDVLDTYETELVLKDAYFEGTITDSLDTKIGHQIVVWGKSDSIRITDVINPLDNRQPGMTDIEDLRLSVAMAKFDYYVGAWNISTMLIAENRVMEEAPIQGEFLPFNLSELEEPKYNFDNPQYALSLNGVFSGWDLSFYGANVLDQKWHINKKTKKREVGIIKMLGSALNIATGSWLLKSEVAMISGVKYNATDDEKNRLDTLVGFDYMGLKETVLSFEVANRHIFDYEDKMNSTTETFKDYTDKNEVQTVVRATHSFANDSINATALISIFGSSLENGGFTRVWVEVDIMDGVSSNIGMVDYIGGDRVFMDAINNNDRVFA